MNMYGKVIFMLCDNFQSFFRKVKPKKKGLAINGINEGRLEIRYIDHLKDENLVDLNSLEN